MKRSGDGPFAIRIARGARAVESELLAEIEFLVGEGIRDPRLLRHPVRVVVPSHSLRAHLAAAILRPSGRAIAGVTVQTLHGVAVEILERSGEPPVPGDALCPILVRQHAREEPALRDCLEELQDGYGIVTDGVSDLLDAGLTPDNAAALEDALEELSHFPALVERARATVRVAVRTLASADGSGMGHRARLVERARELLERDPEGSLPARAIFVHGFAEATGLRAELLEALVRHRHARVFFDDPPDPASSAESRSDWRFSERLRSRLAGVGGVEFATAAPLGPARIAALKAPGAHAEVRAVAGCIREILDAGHCPETIAVVARDLASYRAPVRQHFRRLGIPFSGVSETGSVGATRRRVQALSDLLQRGGRAPADRWLDAVLRLGSGEERGDRSDVRLGLRHIGLVRLEDVANHRADERDIPLPVIGSWRDEDEGDDARGARALRRVLRGATLARAVQGAERAQRGLERLRGATTLGALLSQLRAFLLEDLGWDLEHRDCRPVFDQLDALGAGLPPGFELRWDDFLLLLHHELAGIGTERIGGEGGGVQVLSVMEARARSFDALFLLGLNRDVFPRTIRQDPLLPDVVRRILSAALPDIPIKATGYDEERYLFAQLLSASPQVTLSWQVTSDEGRDCARSTLVDRLAWGGNDLPSTAVPALHARSAGGLHTAGERALLAGLFADRGGFANALPVAFAELNRELPEAVRSVRPEAAAQARLAVLEEWDPLAPRGAAPGPYHGFAGARGGAGDPRSAPLYVTTVEGMARCPWQTFLAKLLRLESPPDPLAALPGSDPRLLGSVVHGALEQIVRAVLPAGSASLDAACAREPVAVSWPGAEAAGAMLLAAARRVLDDEGIALPGLERVLAEQARPFIERARELDWPDAGTEVFVLGAEIEGSIERIDSRGGRCELRFRADRADVANGDLVLTDYKTGKPISERVRQSTRKRNLLVAIGQGRHLQAVVYALAAAATGARGKGRFLFLRPDIDREAAAYPIGSDEAEFSDTFEFASSAVLGAWDAGAFPPRLLDDTLKKENPDCEHCELAAACIRGDSGARRRLAEWLELAAGTGAGELGAGERALLGVWRLRETKASPARGEGA